MKRRTVNETTKQWMIYLQDVKYQLDNFKIEVITDFAKKHQIDTKLGQFLKQSNVIYKDDFGYYKWNEKIPVSIKIINAYRKEQTKRNVGKKFRRIQNINKPAQQELDLLIEATKQKKKPSIKINTKNLKTYRPHQEKQVGLIRKFLRWIY